MKLSQLFDIFRSEASDVVEPQLWTDDNLRWYLNRSLQRLAEEARYFYDATTWRGVAVAAEDPLVPASGPDFRSIIEFDRVIVRGHRKLSVMTMVEFEYGTVYSDYGLQSTGGPRWEETVGEPRVLLTDYHETKGRLVPIPAADRVLDIWAYRLPLEDVLAAGSPEAWDWDLDVGKELLGGVGGTETSADEQTLLLGMKAEAYNKHDADAYDAGLADRFEGQFRDALDKTKLRLLKRRKPNRAVQSNRDYW